MVIFELPWDVCSIIWEQTKRDFVKFLYSSVVHELKCGKYSNVIREMDKIGKKCMSRLEDGKFSFSTHSRFFTIPQRNTLLTPSHVRHLISFVT